MSLDVEGGLRVDDYRGGPRPPVRFERQVSAPYVFTLERRDGPSRQYQPWAIAVIEFGAVSVALRLKAPDGSPHTHVDAFPLERGGAVRFFAEDLPQIGRLNAEVTRNTPSVFFVLKEIEKQFEIRGIGVFRGRVDVPPADPSTPEERVQRVADTEFTARRLDMLATPHEALPR